MPIFYGVYLETEDVSAVLDIVRFLGEPEGIRTSHITMRGPYSKPVRRATLDRMNHNFRNERKIELMQPRTFFGLNQSSVVIEVNLLSLNRLVYKPDFPQSTPHITLYDGKDREFAENLYNILCQYNWDYPIAVTRLQRINSSNKIDDVMLPMFKDFHDLFLKLVGDQKEFKLIQLSAPETRLYIIRSVLERCVKVLPNDRDKPRDSENTKRKRDSMNNRFSSNASRLVVNS